MGEAGAVDALATKVKAAVATIEVCEAAAAVAGYVARSSLRNSGCANVSKRRPMLANIGPSPANVGQIWLAPGRSRRSKLDDDGLLILWQNRPTSGAAEG